MVHFGMPKGIYPRRPRVPKQYPAELVERVRALYTGGASQAEIAVELHTTQKVVWRLMERHGIPRRPKVKRDQAGEKNDSWKGGAAGYAAFHKRVEATKGRPKKCEVCGTNSPALWYDWANLTGAYDEPSDYRRMCRSCHRQYDRQRRKEVPRD